MGRNLRPPPKGDANPPGIRRVMVIIAPNAGGSQGLFNGGKRKGPQDIARYHCGPGEETNPQARGSERYYHGL